MTDPTPRRLRVALAIPPVLLLVIGAFCINDTMMYSPDSVNYLGWAHSLAHLQGFNNTMGPEPERYVYNAPLYPVLLAPLAVVFPLAPVPAKIATLLCGACLLVLFEMFIARQVGRITAIAAGVFLALNPLMILYSTQVLSDIPFGLSCILVMGLLERLLQEPEHTGAWTGPLLIAVTCAALFLREVGIAVVLSAACVLLMRRNIRTLLLLLIAVTALYGLWIIRNEIVVARAEHPGLRNMALVFSHVYTASGATALDEVVARLERSVSFYGPSLLSIAAAPFRAAWRYSVTDSSDPFLGMADAAAAVLRWPLAALTVILVVVGGRRLADHSVHALFAAVLVPIYAVIIALYPVSDIRFLFPPLVFLLWCAAAGCADIVARLNPRRTVAGTVATVLLLILLALPNAAWVRSLIVTNVAYRADPAAYAADAARHDPYPGELMLIPRRAAEWIDAHSPPGTVVASKVKAPALWLEARPLCVLNPLTPVEDFDNRIRDYSVSYLVCDLRSHQVPDFALQMALSNRFRFTEEFTFADVRVYSVSEKTDARQSSLVPPRGGAYRPIETRFYRAVYALAGGDLRRAASEFDTLRSFPGLETSGLFYAAVSREFAGDLEGAEELFARFRTIPQSAAYVGQAKVHEDITTLLREAAREIPREEKSELYQEAAMDYWILGFRTQAVMRLRDALRFNPDNFAANVFGALFSLAGGDTTGARHGVRQAERLRPTDPLTRGLVAALASIDSLPLSPRRGRLEIAIGRQYAGLGLYEMGIDQALKALREGEEPDALRLLADLYIRKGRRAPALAALLRLERVSPGDTAVASGKRRLGEG